MCIFNLAVDRVSGTKILVASTTDNRQLTVYTNTIAFGSSASKDKKSATSSSSTSTTTPGNAMILPCPFAGEGTIELVDLSSLPDLFKKASAAFPKPQFLSRGASASGSLNSRSNYLAGHTVGSYSVSIAETLEDLRRIDPSVFKLEDNISEVLGAHYSKGFGFVVCKFNEGKEMHPIGYIHPRASDDSKLFVPTRHEHGHDGPSEPDWDHEIFSLSCTAQAGPTPNEFKSEFMSDGEIQPFTEQFLGLRLLVPSLPTKFVLRRQEIKGNHENEDLIFDVLPSFLGAEPTLADGETFAKEHHVNFASAQSAVDAHVASTSSSSSSNKCILQ